MVAHWLRAPGSTSLQPNSASPSSSNTAPAPAVGFGLPSGGPGTSASAWGRGGGFGEFHGGFHENWGHRGFGYGYGGGPGWCYFHPYRCERPL
jgi:hypothetical protein